jgi:hypothetical protein
MAIGLLSFVEDSQKERVINHPSFNLAERSGWLSLLQTRHSHRKLREERISTNI